MVQLDHDPQRGLIGVILARKLFMRAPVWVRCSFHSGHKHDDLASTLGANLPH